MQPIDLGPMQELKPWEPPTFEEYASTYSGATLDDYNKAWPQTEGWKEEVDDLAKFLFENKNEILRLSPEDANKWVYENYHGIYKRKQ